MKIVKILVMLSIVVLVALLTVYILKVTVKNELTKSKTELVEKVKAVDFNDTAAAKSVAKTIHKFKSFKDKVKSELKDLDSTDSLKK